jgi:hypothetical protein
VVNGRPLRLPDNGVREKIEREKNGFLGIGSPLFYVFLLLQFSGFDLGKFYPHNDNKKKRTKITFGGSRIV